MEGIVRVIETAPGVSISVRVAGSGPLVILMHGWPELGLSWRHQVGPLAAAGYTVAAPDMRGYGGSSKPAEIEAYALDGLADDMAAVARALGAARWVAVGHDWGAPVAWRSALRFPEAVAAVFGLSVPHTPFRAGEGAAELFPDRFFYIDYFQAPGVAEAELETDVRANLKKIFFALSGDAPLGEWMKPRPKTGPMLPALAEPPAGPLSFMSEAELDLYAEAYRRGGFFGPVSWYRTAAINVRQAQAYGDQRIRQPSGFLCGDKEIVLQMIPAVLEGMRRLCDELRTDIVLPDAGHWIQQERPIEVTEALLGFLAGVRNRLDP
jgi:pimeloyl-ACP methyl ester carboxylesterase